MDLLILILFSVFAVMDSLRWTIKTPSDVHKGSPVTLEWTASLTTDEKLRANRFSLILLEREMFLYSNRWQVMVVKAFLGGMHKEIGNHSSFDVIPGNDMSVRLKKVTDTDLTRFRCTFVSSFAAPKSIIRVDMKDLPIKVRLVGGTTPYKGRVEVYRSGYWGTVCSDGWDVLDASVVCRMLGYIGAWTANCCSEYQGGTGPVWLSDLSCTGRETSLSYCGHGGWGVNNCDHRKDAEVICHNPAVKKTVAHSMAVTNPHVLHSRTPTFSSIRVSSFVPLSSTIHSMQTHLLSPTLAFTATSPKAASQFSALMTVVPSEISSTPSVGVSRSVIPTSPPAVYVQILDDLYGFPNQGRVSLYYNGQWGTVCDDSWNIDDAQVVCQMLGYPRAIGFTTRSHFGGAMGGPIWMDEVKCKGTESTLAACPHGGWGISDCNHSKDAGVICDFNYTVNAEDANCNFDTWYCGWENGPGNPAAFKWTRQFGRTSSYNTGPSRDHTSGSGYYFFIEASWRSGGDVARLETPKIQSNGNATCMVFYYHLYGQSIGTLRVKVGDQVLWELSGNQGDSWYKATVPLNFNGIYKVTFEGVVGNTAFSDIAIDDVEFQENTVCEKTAETLVFPKIHWISPSGEAEPGDNVTLNCTATGLPTPRVLWRKDGRILLERQATVNITIFNISEADGGSYECLAINIVGNDTKTTTINVRGSPKETVITTDASYNVPAQGESVAIRCSSKGFPVPVCRLYHEGNLIDVNGSYFLVRNFTSADQGEYTCNCSNVAGVDVAKLKLVLYESPSIHTILPPYQLRNETDTFELFCNATGYPPPTVMWSKDAKINKVYPTGETLRVEKADKSDFGHYKCTAVSVRGENVTAVASVELDYYSPVIDVVPGNITVLENERRSVKFFCNATGRPAAQISWVKEGINMSFGNTLLITSADRSDRGEYRCVAGNGVGNSASTRVYLDVQYNPSFTRLDTDKINSFVRGNGRVEFTCVTNAKPPSSQYRFYHDNVYLTTSLTGKFVIQKARHFDAGKYTCVPLNLLGTGTNSSVNISVYGAFSIIHSPHNVTVNESESTSFFCNATSYPPHQALTTHITWSKLGDSSKVFPPGQKLSLSNVDRRNAGTYICKAENGLGFPDTAAAVLSVLHKPYDTRLEASVPDNIGVVNSSVTLRCIADANPPVTAYKIYHNGIMVSDSDSGIFNITRARVEDNGSYVCIPFNDFGPGEKASVNVSFVGPCGVKRVYASWSPQIVGGMAAKAGEWPWQVQLGYFDDSESSPHLCGGSILDHYWIITAAHCIKSPFKLRIAASLNVTVGELRRGVPEGSEQNIPAEKIILHKEFDVINLRNDIALIKLKQPILFNAHVSSICLPDVDFAVGTTCYVTGWGRLGPIGSVSDVLQETAIPLFDHWLCKQYYKQNNVNEVTSDMRCAGTLGQSQGTCKADSGGPLACEQHGRWYLLGITSWSNGGCMDQGDPGVFSDTFFFRKWIEDVIANNTGTSL